MRRFLTGQLEPGRTREVADRMRIAGITHTDSIETGIEQAQQPEIVPDIQAVTDDDRVGCQLS